MMDSSNHPENFFACNSAKYINYAGTDNMAMEATKVPCIQLFMICKKPAFVYTLDEFSRILNFRKPFSCFLSLFLGDLVSQKASSLNDKNLGATFIYKILN